MIPHELHVSRSSSWRLRDRVKLERNGAKKTRRKEENWSNSPSKIRDWVNKAVQLSGLESDRWEQCKRASRSSLSIWSFLHFWLRHSRSMSSSSQRSRSASLLRLSREVFLRSLVSTPSSIVSLSWNSRRKIKSSISKDMSQSIYRTTDTSGVLRGVRQFTNQSINQSIEITFDKVLRHISINQLIYLTINTSTDHSIHNQSIDRSMTT